MRRRFAPVKKSFSFKEFLIDSNRDIPYIVIGVLLMA